MVWYLSLRSISLHGTLFLRIALGRIISKALTGMRIVELVVTSPGGSP